MFAFFCSTSSFLTKLLVNRDESIGFEVLKALIFGTIADFGLNRFKFCFRGTKI